MNFLLKGRLCGIICDDCKDPLDKVVVRLYRTVSQTDVVLTHVAANPKQTFGILKLEDVKAKSSRLIAEVETDEQGNFEFQLQQEKHAYQGEALQIDVYLTQVAGQSPDAKADPVQFTITTLQPAWRERDNGLVAVWDYCIPARYWCFIRSLFDAWVICGKVLVAATAAPIPNVIVKAIDNDWIKDDPLGQATTDVNGRFRIDYTSKTFKQTFFSPIVNLETPLFSMPVGPDVYFHVDTGMGTPLLREDPSAGYGSSRENIPNCFCVTLRLKEAPGDDTQVEPLPVFNRVGGYHFLTQIDSGIAGDGKTLGDDRAFFSNMRLNGALPKRLNGQPLEYQFEIAKWSGALPPASGDYSPVPLGKIAKTLIGDLQTVTADPINPVKTEPYYVNGNSPTELVAAVTADGWIQVPQESNAFAGGYFHPNGNMIRLISTSYSSETLNMAGLIAGNSATSTGQPLAHNDFFAIRMWVREAGNPASKQLAGTLPKIAICNARYDNVPQRGSWSPTNVDGVLAVHSIDIEELKVGGGCTKITNNITVKYSAAAANLGTVVISMNGPGGPYGFAPIASSPDTFGTATPSFTVGTLSPCAYTVHLNVQVLLTTGDSIPDNLYDLVAFCK